MHRVLEKHPNVTIYAVHPGTEASRITGVLFFRVFSNNVPVVVRDLTTGVIYTDIGRQYAIGSAIFFFFAYPWTKRSSRSSGARGI